jgi:hypothetical protein
MRRRKSTRVTAPRPAIAEKRICCAAKGRSIAKAERINETREKRTAIQQARFSPSRCETQAKMKKNRARRKPEIMNT